MDKVQKLSTPEQCLNFALICVPKELSTEDAMRSAYKFMEKSPSWEAGQASSRISPLNMESEYSLQYS
jgi:isoaspartyl peptidase/L-asparaginase-like protein (Ntn-hydrolase superfamily)